jgi:hypothetical protein
MHIDCIPCFKKQAEKFILKHGLSNKLADEVRHELAAILDNKTDRLSSPEVGRYLNGLMKSASGHRDVYAIEKREFNEMVMSMYPALKEKVISSENPEYTSLRYALAGNVIDFGPPSEFDAFSAFDTALQRLPVIDHSEKLFKQLKDAETVLYLGDNAGEIVADKLFIETLNHPNLYFAVRGDYVINDVTIEDARLVGLDKIVEVISNGYDAPSTILSACSAKFMNIYSHADIIISKGQGNLEGLIGERDKNIYFLLMVKCEVMARQVCVNIGDAVIWNNQIQGRSF